MEVFLNFYFYIVLIWYKYLIFDKNRIVYKNIVDF